MKQFVVVLFFGLGIMTVSGQNFSELRSVDLSGPEQYEKVEDVVLDCCYYLTGTPNEKKNTTRDDALEFVLRWAKGSPKMIQVDRVLTERLEDAKEIAVMDLYKVCCAMAVIESFNHVGEKHQIDQLGLEALLDYCNNPVNRVKVSKGVREVLKEMQNDFLQASSVE